MAAKLLPLVLWIPALAHCEVQAPRAARPNIVLIIADDLGVDLVGAYREGAAPACTPNIDALAARGVLFRNAWSNPGCSPTRAQLLTGLHGFRSGVGEIIKPNGGNLGLTLPAETLPRALIAYDNAAVGKWHLASTAQGNLHPLDAGFGSHAGSMDNLRIGVHNGGYFHWIKNVNGASHIELNYATTDTTDDAIACANEMAEPWFLYVAYNAPHVPTHDPPAELCASEICPRHYCPPNESVVERTKAAVEALDTEIGRMLAQIDPNTIVIFVGDNGTGDWASEPPFVPEHAKGTVYEGGVNVPLIVAGPGICAGESAALVGAVDIPATIADLTGSALRTPDSISFAALLYDAAAPPTRNTIYAEKFSPNFNPTVQRFHPVTHDRALRNDRFKLLLRSGPSGTAVELYDLSTDPFEHTNLYPPKNAEQAANFAALAETLAGMGVACGADVERDVAVHVTDLVFALQE